MINREGNLKLDLELIHVSAGFPATKNLMNPYNFMDHCHKEISLQG